MCNQTAFIAYWIFGIGASGVVILIASQQIRSKWPGVHQHRIRTLMMIPVSLLGMLLGGLLWIHGAQQVGASVCNAREPVVITSHRAEADALLQSMREGGLTDLEAPASDRRVDSASP